MPFSKIAAIMLLLLTWPVATLADAWPPTVPGYAYQAIERCSAPHTAKLQPNEARYEICVDQMALFTSALDEARRADRLLIVDFGATWCPWCRSLQAQFETGILGRKDLGLDYAATFNVLEIGTSTMQAGRRVDVPSGQAVLKRVLATAPGVKLRAVPFLAVIDPANAAKTVARNLDDFELGATGAHDPAQIRTVLVAAHGYMRLGGAAPSEPGWIATKFARLRTRLWGSSTASQ